jgi:hypothetical protein
VCLGSEEGAEKRKRGTGGSLKPVGMWGEKEREGGGGRDRVEATRRKKKGGGVGVGVRWVGVVDRHDTDAAAPGCSDSSGWRTPHGRGGSGLRTRGATGVSDSRAGGNGARWLAVGCGRERARAIQRRPQLR